MLLLAFFIAVLSSITRSKALMFHLQHGREATSHEASAAAFCSTAFHEWKCLWDRICDSVQTGKVCRKRFVKDLWSLDYETLHQLMFSPRIKITFKFLSVTNLFLPSYDASYLSLSVWTGSLRTVQQLFFTVLRIHFVNRSNRNLQKLIFCETRSLISGLPPVP